MIKFTCFLYILTVFSCGKSQVQKQTNYVIFYEVNETMTNNKGLLFSRGNDSLSKEDIKEIEEILKRKKWDYKVSTDSRLLIDKRHVPNIERMYSLMIEWKSVPMRVKKESGVPPQE